MRMIAICILLLSTITVVVADQNDSRLGDLFQRLQNPHDLAELRTIEAEIWSIWTDSGDGGINALMSAGISAMQQRDYDQALDKFNEIIHLKPDFAEGWNKRATVYYLRDEYSESMQDVQKTLALEPRHFGALSGIGLIFIKLGDQVGAIKAFEEVLKVHPYSFSAQYHIEQLRSGIEDNVI